MMAAVESSQDESVNRRKTKGGRGVRNGVLDGGSPPIIVEIDDPEAASDVAGPNDESETDGVALSNGKDVIDLSRTSEKPEGSASRFQMKSATFQLPNSQALPVTRIFTSSSPSSLTPSLSSTTQSRPPQPHPQPYYLVDIEVKLKPGCHDILLEGRVGVVTRISGKMATVQIRDNSSDITIPHESLAPVNPRPSDMVKVIRGAESMLGLIGTMVSKIGTDGVVQFNSSHSQRRRNPAQIPISYLGRYTPRSKFAPGGGSSGSIFKVGSSGSGKVSNGIVAVSASATTSSSGSNVGGSGGGGSAVVSATPMMLPLQFFAMPSGVVTSLGPYFASGLSSSSASFISPFSSTSSSSSTSSNSTPSSSSSSTSSSSSSSLSTPPTFTSFFPSSSLSSFTFSSPFAKPPSTTTSSSSTPPLSRYFSSAPLFKSATEMNDVSKDSASNSRLVPVLSSSSVVDAQGTKRSAYYSYSPVSNLPSTKKKAVLDDGRESSSRTVPGESSEPRTTFYFAGAGLRGSPTSRGSVRQNGAGSLNGTSRLSRGSKDDDSHPFLFKRVPNRVDQDIPDSTTRGEVAARGGVAVRGGVEKDSARPAKLPFYLAGKYVPMPSATPPTSSSPVPSNWNNLNLSRTNSETTRADKSRLPVLPRLDTTNDQIFHFPASLTASQKVQMFLANHASDMSMIKGRGGGGSNDVDGSGASNGYSIGEVLEKLVRSQRNYSYELSSPTTPGGSSHDVKTSCVRVSLVCPLSQQRMKYPSRGKGCKHLQCFDAENYINFHEKQMVRKRQKHMGLYTKPAHQKKWNCPICERITHIHQLYIDKDLMKLVQESDAVEVEMSKTGSWVPVDKHTQKDIIVIDDD